MDASIREPRRAQVPHALVLAAATTCGILAALVSQAVLARRGIEASEISRDLISARPQLRSAGAWWLVAAAAFLVSAAAAGILNRGRVLRLRLQALRLIAAVAIVFALAHFGHSAGPQSANAIGMHVAASLAWLCAATLIALLGAYLAARR